MKVPSVIKKMLVNKYVLYVILFISITNILGYLGSQDFNALTFFVIVAFLTTYFSKNMIIVLLVAMVSTNFLSMSNRIPHTIEAMSNNKRKDKQGVVAAEEDNETIASEAAGVTADKAIIREKLKPIKELQPASLEENKVNYQDTLESAYDNLDKILDSGAIQNMSKDTDKLMKRQDKLAGQIEKFGPILQQAEKMLSKLPMGKMNSMISKLGGMGMLAGAADSQKK